MGIVTELINKAREGLEKTINESDIQPVIEALTKLLDTYSQYKRDHPNPYDWFAQSQFCAISEGLLSCELINGDRYFFLNTNKLEKDKITQALSTMSKFFQSCCNLGENKYTYENNTYYFSEKEQKIGILASNSIK